METPTLEHATGAARALLRDHPVLSRYQEALSVLLVGSIPTGFADARSDVDLWFLCAPDAWSPLADALQQAGSRTEGWPNETEHDGLPVHYFVMPLSKYEAALEAQDDQSLYIAAHSPVLHDANGQLAGLLSRCAPLSEALVRRKRERARTLVRQRADSLEALLKRDHPLTWMDETASLAHAALELCCWLDGEPPIMRLWMLQQAAQCRSSAVILPAVRALLQAFGGVLAEMPPGEVAKRCLCEAAHSLAAACQQAAECVGETRNPNVPA